MTFSIYAISWDAFRSLKCHNVIIRFYVCIETALRHIYTHLPNPSIVSSRSACHENADRPSIFIEHRINVITEHVNDVSVELEHLPRLKCQTDVRQTVTLKVVCTFSLELWRWYWLLNSPISFYDEERWDVSGLGRLYNLYVDVKPFASSIAIDLICLPTRNRKRIKFHLQCSFQCLDALDAIVLS